MMRTYEQGAGRPDRIEVEAYGITVCSLSAADLHDAADARLIAAAPELLEALAALLWQHDHNGGVLCGMALQDARAAVARATGKDN